MPEFSNVAVVGMHFRGAAAKEAVSLFDLSTELTLEPEPENKYDGNALAVYFGDLHIGYIEATQAAWITPALAAEWDEEEECWLLQPYTIQITSFEQRGKNLHPIVTINVTSAD
jgi:hypothetical protein